MAISKVAMTAVSPSGSGRWSRRHRIEYGYVVGTSSVIAIKSVDLDMWQLTGKYIFTKLGTSKKTFLEDENRLSGIDSGAVASCDSLHRSCLKRNDCQPLLTICDPLKHQHRS
jgi:hypothetical protein